MCICVHCNHPVDYLYTSYKSASNIRLSVCPGCNAFADPLIEHPPTLLLIDLVLLKPRVYRHLLFNRGSRPNRPGEEAVEQYRTAIIWRDLQRWSLVVLAVESFVKLKRFDLPRITQSPEVLWLFSSTFWTILLENLAQHAVTICLTWSILRWKGWLLSGPERKERGKEKDGRRLDFRIPLISLTLLYASLLPLLLHLIISIWTPETSLSATPTDLATHLPHKASPALNLLRVPPSWDASLPIGWARALETLCAGLRDEGISEMWVAIHLLGGMSSGFALRVLLPTRPWETSGIVLGGWLAKTAVAWWLH